MKPATVRAKEHQEFTHTESTGESRSKWVVCSTSVDGARL